MAKKKSDKPARPRKPTYIRAWREHFGLTQAEVEARITDAGDKLSEGQISRIENGKSAYTQEALEMIASALGVPEADLIGRDPAATKGLQDLSRELSPDDLVRLMRFGQDLRRTGS